MLDVTQWGTPLEVRCLICYMMPVQLLGMIQNASAGYATAGTADYSAAAELT
jgi:hypothetical protein